MSTFRSIDTKSFVSFPTKNLKEPILGASTKPIDQPDTPMTCAAKIQFSPSSRLRRRTTTNGNNDSFFNFEMALHRPPSPEKEESKNEASLSPKSQKEIRSDQNEQERENQKVNDYKEQEKFNQVEMEPKQENASKGEDPKEEKDELIPEEEEPKEEEAEPNQEVDETIIVVEEIKEEKSQINGHEENKAHIHLRETQEEQNGPLETQEPIFVVALESPEKQTDQIEDSSEREIRERLAWNESIREAECFEDKSKHEEEGKSNIQKPIVQEKNPKIIKSPKTRSYSTKFLFTHRLTGGYFDEEVQGKERRSISHKINSKRVEEKPSMIANYLAENQESEEFLKTKLYTGNSEQNDKNEEPFLFFDHDSESECLPKTFFETPFKMSENSQKSKKSSPIQAIKNLDEENDEKEIHNGSSIQETSQNKKEENLHENNSFSSGNQAKTTNRFSSKFEGDQNDQFSLCVATELGDEFKLPLVLPQKIPQTRMAPFSSKPSIPEFLVESPLENGQGFFFPPTRLVEGQTHLLDA